MYYKLNKVFIYSCIRYCKFKLDECLVKMEKADAIIYEILKNCTFDKGTSFQNKDDDL